MKEKRELVREIKQSIGGHKAYTDRPAAYKAGEGAEDEIADDFDAIVTYEEQMRDITEEIREVQQIDTNADNEIATPAAAAPANDNSN